MKLFKDFQYASDKNNLRSALSLLKRNLQENHHIYIDGGGKFKVKRVGRLLLGEAFYHEVNEYYDCLGFEVEIEYQHSFMKSPEITVSFYSIWADNKHECAPLDFTEGQGFGKEHHFTNGLGDHIQVLDVIIPIAEVQEILSKNRIL